MTKAKSKKKHRPARVAQARVVPVAPESQEEPESPPETLPNAEAGGLERAMAEAMGEASAPAAPSLGAPANSPADPESSTEGSSTPKVVVGTMGPGLRERVRKPGRRTRRQLELENKELRKQLPPAPGEESEPAAPPAVVDYTSAGELVRFLVETVFDIMAMERGEHWRLDQVAAEKVQLHGGRALGPLLPALGAFLPWIFLGTVLGRSVTSRVAIDKAQADARKRAAPAPPARPESPPAAGGVN